MLFPAFLNSPLPPAGFRITEEIESLALDGSLKESGIINLKN